MMNMALIFPPIVIVILALILGLKLKRGTKEQDNKMDSYIKEEHDVNFIRKKEVESSYFVVPNLKKLPIKEYDEESEVSECQKLVLQKAELEMVHFDKQMSNLELKKIYGANNLHKIIDFEEHFNMYISALNKWAEALVKAERITEAEEVLKEAVSFGSDYLMTYTLLIDVYDKNNQKVQIDKLKDDIVRDKFFDNSILKNRILNYMEYKFGA